MFIRTAAAFLSISSKIAGRSSDARRCLFSRAPCGGGSPLPMGLFIHAPTFLTLLGTRGASVPHSSQEKMTAAAGWCDGQGFG